MKSLLKWLVIVGVVLAIFAFIITKYDKAATAREEAQRQEERDRRTAEAERQERIDAAIAGAPVPESARNVQFNNEAEYKFRQLAEQNQVEVLDYRAISTREAFVHLRTRNQTGIGDLLDDAIYEDVISNFDDNLYRQNQQLMIDPNGARIWDVRFTMTIEML